MNDDARFSRIYVQCHPLLLRHARRWLGDSQQAEELAHEVLVRGWKYRHSLRSDEDAPRWLTCALFRELAKLRKKQTIEREFLRELSHERPLFDPGPESIDDVLSFDIASYTQGLPPSLAEFIEAGQEQEWNIQRIAERLGRPEQKVRDLKYRLKNRLLDLHGWSCYIDALPDDYPPINGLIVRYFSGYARRIDLQRNFWLTCFIATMGRHVADADEIEPTSSLMEAVHASLRNVRLCSPHGCLAGAVVTSDDMLAQILRFHRYDPLRKA